MRILSIANFDSNFGGGGFATYKLLEYLARRGHQIDCFYTSYLKVFTSNKNLNMHQKFEYARHLRGSSKINSLITKFYDSFSLNRFLKKNHKEIDLIFGYQKSSAVKAEKLGKKYGIRVANFIFETPLWIKEQNPDWKKSWDNSLILRNEWKSFKSSIQNSDIVFSNSDLTSVESKKWCNREADCIIYPGYEIPHELSEENVDKKNQIIYVGRLEKNKNINHIFEALNKIPNPPKIVICGFGSEYKNLLEISRKLNLDCKFLGKVSEVTKWAEIQRSKFMVFPSTFEGFGMPPMEALACKIPCIAYNLPILSSVYGDMIDYVETGNIDMLSKVIARLNTDSNYCRTRGIAGFEFVKNKFNWMKSAKKFEDFLGGK